MAETSVDGLVSGLSTSQLISQLMQLERQPQVRLKAKRDAANSLVSTYQALNTRVATLRDAATALATTSGWQVMKATSSLPASATATATSTAVPGTLSFTVDRLAGTHSLITLGSVASTSAVVIAPGSSLFLAQAGGLGFGTLTASAGVATGSHTIEVTQASSGASQSGSPLASSVTVAGGLTLEVAVDGSTTTTHTLNLAAGTYSRNELSDMVATASGGLLRAAVNNDGSLKLTTTREGSAARLAVTGGSGMATLGLSVSGIASSGTSGVVKVDGTTTTVTDTSVTTALDAGGGQTLTATFSGGLRVGTVTAKNVTVGDGTLAAVVTAINGAGAGMTASAVQAGPGVYKLQVASKTSGQAGSLSLDPAVFSASLGALETLSQGIDARLTVGSGATAFRVTSGSNAFSEVMPGVTINALKADTSQPITVSVTNDSGALADKVSKLVESVNGVVSYVKLQSVYNTDTRKGGPLLGDATARQVESELYRTVSNLVSGTSLSAAGLSVTKEGYLSFDRAAFLVAYDKDPTAVAAYFHDAGTVEVTDDGLGKRLEAMAKAATDSVSGVITTAIAGRKSEVSTLEKSIDAWDVRLDQRETALKRQFSALETALGKLKNQSSWLTGQLAGLPGFTRSN